jgi:hypothetical protein
MKKIILIIALNLISSISFSAEIILNCVYQKKDTTDSGMEDLIVKIDTVKKKMTFNELKYSNNSHVIVEMTNEIVHAIWQGGDIFSSDIRINRLSGKMTYVRSFVKQKDKSTVSHTSNYNCSAAKNKF